MFIIRTASQFWMLGTKFEASLLFWGNNVWNSGLLGSDTASLGWWFVTFWRKCWLDFEESGWPKRIPSRLHSEDYRQDVTSYSLDRKVMSRLWGVGGAGRADGWGPIKNYDYVCRGGFITNQSAGLSALHTACNCGPSQDPSMCLPDIRLRNRSLSDVSFQTTRIIAPCENVKTQKQFTFKYTTLIILAMCLSPVNLQTLAHLNEINLRNFKCFCWKWSFIYSHFCLPTRVSYLWPHTWSGVKKSLLHAWNCLYLLQVKRNAWLLTVCVVSMEVQHFSYVQNLCVKQNYWAES